MTHAARGLLRRYGLRALLVVVAVAGVVYALRGRVPNPHDLVDVLGAADPRWLAAAVVAQALSQGAFARQQRTLLAALDVRVKRRHALAITYSRSAMSMVLPAGSAMSAAFALRQYRRQGASTAVAATGMVLSGAASLLGLALLYAGAVGTSALIRSCGLLIAAALLVAALVTVVWASRCLVLRRTSGRRAASRGRPADVAGMRSVATEVPGRRTVELPAFARRVAGLPARAVAQLRLIVREARSVRLRDGAATVAYAILNWLFDLLCLVAVARACGLPLTVAELATVYLAVQVVRQIPLTPGGFGLIEAALLAGLVTAGAPQAAAAAVVLGYRVVSFWLLLPPGLISYIGLTRSPRLRAAEVPA